MGQIEQFIAERRDTRNNGKGEKRKKNGQTTHPTSKGRYLIRTGTAFLSLPSPTVDLRRVFASILPFRIVLL